MKDVIGPKGAVAVVHNPTARKDQVDEVSDSADIDRHTKTDAIRYHHADVGEDKNFIKKDGIFALTDEPGQQEFCKREQAFFSGPSLKISISASRWMLL